MTDQERAALAALEDAANDATNRGMLCALADVADLAALISLARRAERMEKAFDLALGNPGWTESQCLEAADKALAPASEQETSDD
jgi:hypothetical protein